MPSEGLCPSAVCVEDPKDCWGGRDCQNGLQGGEEADEQGVRAKFVKSYTVLGHGAQKTFSNILFALEGGAIATNFFVCFS